MSEDIKYDRRSIFVASSANLIGDLGLFMK